MELTLIIFLIVVVVWQGYQTLKLAKIMNDEMDKIWKAIDKINEGSYLIKDKEGD